MDEAIHRAREAAHENPRRHERRHRGRDKELSQYAPRIETIKIKPDKIGLLIGPGGKNIKGIVAETGAEINIEDDGTVHIYSNNGEASSARKEIILGMTKEIDVGEIYTGPRRQPIKDSALRRSACPARTASCHISELADFRVNRTEDVVKVGDVIWVKCIGVDDKGRVKLSPQSRDERARR